MERQRICGMCWHSSKLGPFTKCNKRDSEPIIQFATDPLDKCPLGKWANKRKGLGSLVASIIDCITFHKAKVIAGPSCNCSKRQERLDDLSFDWGVKIMTLIKKWGAKIGIAVALCGLLTYAANWGWGAVQAYSNYNALQTRVKANQADIATNKADIEKIDETINDIKVQLSVMDTKIDIVLKDGFGIDPKADPRLRHAVASNHETK